ncbi:MAG: hypothetical protein K2N72_02650 [Oscillospiraceae bacterium]|nr:hypothetical protein [Oscillospiraceae bacterium]
METIKNFLEKIINYTEKNKNDISVDLFYGVVIVLFVSLAGIGAGYFLMWKALYMAPYFEFWDLAEAWGVAVESAFVALAAEVVLMIFFRQRISEHMKAAKTLAIVQLILGAGLILINLPFILNILMPGILDIYIDFPIPETFLFADIPVGISLFIPSKVFWNRRESF